MKPKKLTPPEKEYVFYVEIDKQFSTSSFSNTSDYRSRSWKSNFNKISKEEVTGYNIEWIYVPKNVYDAKKVGLITIQYSTGSTFGREDGLLCVGCISHKKEVIESALCLLRNWDKRSSEKLWQELEEKYKKDAFFQSFYTFSGYFEFIESVDVEVIDFEKQLSILDNLE